MNGFREKVLTIELFAEELPGVREMVLCSISQVGVKGHDVGYLLERKTAVLKRMLAPNNIGIRQLSQDDGISAVALNECRAAARKKGKLLLNADADPEGLPSSNKFAAMLEAGTLNEADLARYCLKPGLYRVRIAAWRSKDSGADARVSQFGANDLTFSLI